MDQLLKDELDLLRSRVFPKSSERLDPNQLKPFAAVSAATEELEAEEVKAHKRKKRAGHGRQSLPDHPERADGSVL